MNSWNSALIHMNTLMAVKARTPPVLMLQNITFHVPGLTPSARVRVVWSGLVCTGSLM